VNLQGGETTQGLLCRLAAPGISFTKAKRRGKDGPRSSPQLNEESDREERKAGRVLLGGNDIDPFTLVARGEDLLNGSESPKIY